tara:strand:+ start:742 stop:1329 length:588 start_codon:yes stop_codon:yes gene_type:complete
MKSTTLLFLSIIVFSLAACKSNKEAAAEQTITSEKSQSAEMVPTLENDAANEWPDEGKEQYNRVIKGVADSLFFKMERTSCFGRCPTYEVSVFNSGYVVYNGKRNVERIGFFESQISKDQMDLILKKSNEIGFFKLKDRYDGNMTDVPSTIILMQYNDNLKVVVDRVQGPQELKQFQLEMDQLLLNLDYKAKEMY